MRSASIDVTKTNAVTAERIATALDVEWRPGDFTIKNKVNLAGLNALLEEATDAYYEGTLVRLQGSTPAALTGPGWAAFQPAVSKIEAITRIARLTGAPQEHLGPGSKEHKTLLVNLADNLLGDAALDRGSKTRLARDIAMELGVTWTDTCYSTGETISLEGLNIILAGAERRLGRLGSSSAEVLATPQAEAEALVAALVSTAGGANRGMAKSASSGWLPAVLEDSTTMSGRGGTSKHAVANS